MDIRSKLTINISEELIKALGITEDTFFIVNYENGKLTIEPIIVEDDDKPVEIDGSDILAELDAEYEEGYAEGLLDGYHEGYTNGYADARAGRPFDDTLPDEIEPICDHDCTSCQFYDAANEHCKAPKKGRSK